MYLRWNLNTISGIVCNMGALKQNSDETGGKLVPIHNTVTLQWCVSFPLSFSGYFHKVFICATGAAKVCAG